ncbi:MAG: hypothetical protein LH614_19195 [Pyrinomonadaceae bacterium]|nr:hypothetical protein [Pyrinomonadaceae bacterium]
MENWIEERENRLRDFFEIAANAELISREAAASFNIAPHVAEHLLRHNIEWHVIPSADTVSIDTDDYRRRLYPTLKFDSASREYQKTASYRAIMTGHQRHQGRIIGVETTMKPKYLPGNRQFYGTHYGFEPKADPFAAYFGEARIMSGTRYSQNYRSLRNLVNLITENWTKRGLMPPGYRLTVCPPVVFNLIGTIFHPEWSRTESLELGFYRDENNNAKCYAVGLNAPDDFSYIHEIETESDWELLGFRTALVPIS